VHGIQFATRSAGDILDFLGIAVATLPGVDGILAACVYLTGDVLDLHGDLVAVIEDTKLVQGNGTEKQQQQAADVGQQ
jgi:hypothetical protein